MKLKSILFEAPIKDLDTVGDFSRNSSFRDPRDRRIVTNPKSQDIIKKKFGKTDQDINLFFVNSPAANKHTEIGMVTLEWVRQELGDEVADKVENSHDEDSITVIFTNNKGAARVAMTPWVMAHRIGHVLQRFGPNGRFRHLQAYTELEDAVERNIELIYEAVYGIPFDSTRVSVQRQLQLLYKHLAHQIGNFRSAKDKNLREHFEFVNELIAQYMINGSVTFRDLPRQFKAGKFGMITVKHEEEYEQYKDLGMFERDTNYLINQLLNDAMGSIYVM